MTEKILSLVLAYNNVLTFSDMKDVKYHKSINHRNINYKKMKYKLLDKNTKSNINDYQYASHYHCD